MGPGSGAAGRALAGLGSIRKRVRAGALGAGALAGLGSIRKRVRAGALGAGAGRRAQGGTRSSGRLLGLREGGLGRRRGRELERRRLELDLARHLQRGQTRQRCTLQRNRTAAGALSKSPARTDAEAQTHSSAKTMRANSASGRHLLVELVLLELLELALQLVVVEVDPRVQLAAARRGALSVGRSEESGRRRPVLSNARCGGEVALHAALNRGHCPNETSALIVVVNAGQGRAWCASASWTSFTPSISSCISSLSSSIFSDVTSLVAWRRPMMACFCAVTCSALKAAFSSAVLCVMMFCSMLSLLSICFSRIFFRFKHARARCFLPALLSSTASLASSLFCISRYSMRFLSSCTPAHSLSCRRPRNSGDIPTGCWCRAGQ